MDDIITVVFWIVAGVVVLRLIGGALWALFSSSDDAMTEKEQLRRGMDELNADAYRKAGVAQKGKSQEAGKVAREARRLALRETIKYYEKFPEDDYHGNSLRRSKEDLHESEYYEGSPTTTDPKAWKEYEEGWKKRRS